MVRAFLSLLLPFLHLSSSNWLTAFNFEERMSPGITVAAMFDQHRWSTGRAVMDVLRQSLWRFIEVPLSVASG